MNISLSPSVADGAPLLRAGSSLSWGNQSEEKGI